MDDQSQDQASQSQTTSQESQGDHLPRLRATLGSNTGARETWGSIATAGDGPSEHFVFAGNRAYLANLLDTLLPFPSDLLPGDPRPDPSLEERARARFGSLRACIAYLGRTMNTGYGWCRLSAEPEAETDTADE